MHTQKMKTRFKKKKSLNKKTKKIARYLVTAYGNCK